MGSPILPVKEDYQTVNRFESNGGGWGYSGHSVEAIRFMCDTDILLGNYLPYYFYLLKVFLFLCLNNRQITHPAVGKVGGSIFLFLYFKYQIY